MRALYSRGTLMVWADFAEDRALRIDGQDLHESGGYEYFIRIAREHLPLLCDSLGGSEGDDVLELVVANRRLLGTAGEKSWLEARGVPFSSTTGTTSTDHSVVLHGYGVETQPKPLRPLTN